MRFGFFTSVLTCLILLGASPVRAESEAHESRGEKIAVWLEDKGLSRSTAVAAISTLPIVELRGSIPAGFILQEIEGRRWREWTKEERREKVKAVAWIYGVAVAGNMIPIPFILLLLGPLSRFCMRFKIGKRFFEWLFARTRKKSASIEKYEALGLTIFVAIPLPVTGGWTGAMAAFLMGIPFWKSMLYILLGVMIAGVIMTALSLLGWMGAAIAGVVLIGLVGVSVAKTFRPW
ncbi:MAG: small multi-drug export protein [Kiritimatiellales bacterium]|nr:small multi-drug export protein [Kiritimatiellales bacterium]